MATEVTIDEICCALTGYCQRVAPEIFEIQSDKPIVQVKHRRIEDRALVEKAYEAEANCPTAAILLDEVR